MSASRKPKRVWPFVFAAAIGASALAYTGVRDRARSLQEVKNWTDQQAVPSVRVVQPTKADAEQDLVLPGNISAFYSGSLFARASGYIQDWRKDIGERVAAGDVLATISAPDLDQQLAEAKGQLAQYQAAVVQAQANADLGKVTDQRTAQLVAQGWQSKQQGDTDRLTAAARDAALSVARANVVAQQAAVQRLQELIGFEQIRAPFAGIVTQRTVDVGDLVSAGGNTGRPLFQVADIHRVRIYVSVPQGLMGELSPQAKATLALPGVNGGFEAEMVSSSHAVNESSRTTLVELQADNPQAKLLPGAFVEVHFHVPIASDKLSAPLTSLIFGPAGMQVAELGADNRVTLKTVRIGRDLGNRVEIEAGLASTDRLVDNPPESMQTGDVVRVATPEAASAAVAAKNASTKEE